MGVLTEKPSAQARFRQSIDLLRYFLARREHIAEKIEALLNAQRKPLQYFQDRPLLSRHFEDCFLGRDESIESRIPFPTPLTSQLEEAYWAAGFRPRRVHHVHNDLIDPVEMMMRAFHCWQQTRWPGRSGRIHYAHTLFNLYILRSLEFLSLRLWDEDGEGARNASERLAELQGVLDQLWRSSPAGQPAMVRDARWLIPLAQSLITDELAPYFEVARQVRETLPETDRLEIQKAQVRMLGGHLASQIRYYCTKDGVPISDHSVVLRMRASNALDFALLVQGLVELLQAYDRALQSGDERKRRELAGAICQGISPDPELFLNRVDLLGAYTMIEDVFIASKTQDDPGGGHVAYSPHGDRHLQLLKQYGALIGHLIAPLRDDCRHFKPVNGRCSPYGVIFGLPSNLIEHMALKALQHDAETRYSLEDVFDDEDSGGVELGGAKLGGAKLGGTKLAWVNGWRNLPHIDPAVQRLYEYPQQFAVEVYDRIEHEFRRREAGNDVGGGSRTGRLYVSFGNDPEADSNASAIPELPARYFVSSEKQTAAAHEAQPDGKSDPYDRAQLLRDRKEAHFLVSYETPGGWIALKKDLLTEVLGAGRDARIVGLPLEAAQVLRLMCTGLVAPAHEPNATGAQHSIERT